MRRGTAFIQLRPIETSEQTVQRHGRTKSQGNSRIFFGEISAHLSSRTSGIVPHDSGSHHLSSQLLEPQLRLRLLVSSYQMALRMSIQLSPGFPAKFPCGRLSPRRLLRRGRNTTLFAILAKGSIGGRFPRQCRSKRSLSRSFRPNLCSICFVAERKVCASCWACCLALSPSRCCSISFPAVSEIPAHRARVA